MNSVQKSLTPPEKKAIRAIAQQSCPYRISSSQSVIVVPGPTAPYMVGEPGYYSREDQSYYSSTLTLEVGEDWLATKRSGGSSRDPASRGTSPSRKTSLEELRRAIDAAKARDKRENTVASFRAYERALEAFHAHHSSRDPRQPATLSETQIAALCLANSRKSGLITSGQGYTTSKSTLQSLVRSGLLVHSSSGGSFYRYWSQYKITDTGRVAALEYCAHYSRGNVK